MRLISPSLNLVCCRWRVSVRYLLRVVCHNLFLSRSGFFPARVLVCLAYSHSLSSLGADEYRSGLS